MSRLAVVEYVSLDGVIQAPGNADEDRDGFDLGGWTEPHMGEHRRYMSDVMVRAGAFLFGRLTYEIFAAYWPTVINPHDAIAAALNTLPKYVASSTMADAAWTNTIVLRGDVVAAVSALKKRPGRDIVVIGSSQLAQTLMTGGLVDEYYLWLHPIVLGSGKQLFRRGGPTTRLQLLDARTTDGGLVLLTYQPLNGRVAA
jgi:dihydrofolate reductase